MKIQKYLAILLALTLLLCLLPATALADDEKSPEEPVETEEPGEDEDEGEGEGEEPADPEEPEEPADPEEPEEPEAPAEEPVPVEAPEEKAEEDEVVPSINEEDQVCYPMEGEIVYNNGGTAYNNGALVYNNGGLVYQNSGTVYNNGGTVYANGGVVYNNGGTVYRNDALVYTFADDVQDSHVYGSCKVTLAADYSAFARIEGLTADGYLNQDESLVITPLEGWILIGAESDTGVFTENEDGSRTLSEAEGDFTLSLQFKPEAPVFDLEEGCYAEEQTLAITAPEGTEIYYTTDGSEPREDNSLLYEEPLTLTEGVIITAVALADGAEPSDPTAASYAFISVSAPALADGKAGANPPKAAAFTLENPGAVDARIESVELEGKNADCFKLNTGKGGVVKAGETDETTWTIQPVKDLKKGRYTAAVVFTLAGGEKVEVTISYKVKAA